jgi:hypothetical protein
MERGKRFAHEFFVDEWTINLGGIKKRDPAFDCGVKKIGHLLQIFGRAVGKAHAHAAEAES